MPDPVLDLLGAHRTVRSFRDDPIPTEDLERAVRAGQMASTSSNVQGYCALRVTDAAKRAALVELTGGQPQVAQAGAFLVICADQRRHVLAAAARGRPYEANLETFLVAVVDASLFAQNVVIALESMGYGICYIGGLRNRLPEADALLGLPEHVMPLYGLCVGVPAEEPGQRPRLPLGAVLFEDAYPTDERMGELLAAYDATTAAYYGARGRPGWNWTDGLTRKFQEPRRTHLLAHYEHKGARFR